MSECRSFSSNYRCCSQSRKISIGVLIDSMSKAETKNEKESVKQIPENGTSSKGNSVKDREGHTPLVEKHVTVVQKDSSPWVSTRSFNPKISSSVAAHDTEHTPSFPATSRKRPISKRSEKASAAHSLKSFACKTGLVSDKCRNKNFGKATYSFEVGKVNNLEHVENLGFSTEPGVLLEKEPVEDKDRKTETGGRETLRMKLWEVLGNVSPSERHCPSSQSVELYPERDRKQSPTEKRNPNSDTIESDSEKHTFKRPVTRSLTRKNSSTKKQHSKIEATKTTCHRKEGSEKRIFSFRGEGSGRLYSNLNDGSLPSKRNKSVRASSEVKTYQCHPFENAEERQQSVKKIRSIPVVDKIPINEVLNANSSNERRTDVFVEPKSGSKNSNPYVSPVNVMTEQQKDVEQPIDVEISNMKKNQQQRISESLLKNKRNSIHNPSTPPFEVTSHVCLSKSKQRELRDQSPAEKIFNTKGIQSFKSLLSSNSAEHSFIVEEDSESQMFKSSTDATDSDSSEDDSEMKETQVSSQLQMYLKQNHEDGLARAVALFAIALDCVKNKLKSISSKRSAEILRDAGEEIFLLLQNAESHIKTDLRKLTNLSQVKRKQLETRLQEQQEQLAGIRRRFAEEVDRHLKDYDGVVEDLEEHEIEVKRSVERQRSAHKNILLQVEQDVQFKLDAAENRVMAIQEDVSPDYI
ncbi:hypothetical protein MIMGU_mgv1a026180mg [Erythranthe guttata]|uniref:Meiosis-specific protein ASY3-like coiled-coil domain-containing protein n=1 Tax=Erythranthe guttata TaxID=4155 RepID=A0A022S4K7_ERYGU|nr:hypothetical protein MIMGU_mgv1a026180mg [Erythranthe guttata]